MKKGAIFDQDGLMFDTEKIYEECWFSVAEEMKIQIPDGYFAGIRGSSGENLMNKIRAFLPGVNVEEYVKKVYALSFEIQNTRLPEKRGLREILEFFHQNGVKMCVASSTERSRVEKNMKKSGILHYFDNLTTGDEVSAGKPNPEIFLKAAAKMGLAPEDCYVFEDSFNGVRAGHAAGCCTVMVPDVVAPDEEISRLYDMCCKDLLEVVECIKQGKI